MDKKMNRDEKPLNTKKGFTDKLGEVVEKAGDRIADAGAPGLGKKIHDAGDRLEKTHSRSQSNVSKKDY